jgi:hypothetical protein
MARNVTEFKHLIKNKFITENDLDWVINLRDNNTMPIKKTYNAGTSDVYYKKTKTFEIKTNKNHT